MERPGRLEITTRIGCRCNCVYCPQSLLISRYFNRDKNSTPDKIMSLDTFKTCINKLPEGTRIDFSGMAEPWLNPECTNMVLYAYEKGFPIAIYSTLIGMTQRDFEVIKDIPYEEFVVHIPDDKSNSHIDTTPQYIKLLEKVMEYKQANGKSLVTGVSCHAGIHPAIKNAIPDNSKLITEIHNRAGNINDEYVECKNNTGEIVCINCGIDMHHNVLLPDGTVLLCCMDYGMKHILGNLLNESYEEINVSSEAKRIRNGLKDEKADILCRNCVNARNINELYYDYCNYKEWVEKLDEQYAERVKELCDYKEWVERLEGQGKKDKDEIKRINEQYKQRIKELCDYKEWVQKLEKQEKEDKDEIKRINEQYEQRIKELHEYRDWVNNLQKQYDEVIDKINNSKE